MRESHDLSLLKKVAAATLAFFVLMTPFRLISLLVDQGTHITLNLLWESSFALACLGALLYTLALTWQKLREMLFDVHQK